MERQSVRDNPELLLRQLGTQPRLTVYLSAAPGSGKTRRLLTEARERSARGVRVLIGWIETKGRPNLAELCEGLAMLPTKSVDIGGSRFDEFDLAAALEAKPDTIVLDELPHSNLQGSANAKRWQDANALRTAGINVLTAFNIQHLESVAPTAERLLGFPIREIIPDAFLAGADEVIALDVSPEQLAERIRAGLIVSAEDANAALAGPFKPSTLRLMRELLMRTIDELTVPAVEARRVSTAVLFAPSGADVRRMMRRASEVANALDLALEVAVERQADFDGVQRSCREAGAQVIVWPQTSTGLPTDAVSASLIVVPRGQLAARIVSGAIERDVFVVSAESQTAEIAGVDIHPLAQTAGDRMRIGYGRLTIYLGASAGCGKTFAMLDRAHEMVRAGVDVVGAFVETHGRKETAALVPGLEMLPRKTIESGGVRREELDVDSLLKRRPEVALIDELAHTNAPGSVFTKRYEDVLSVLRAGISVLSTLNIQHLEGLGEAVARLTGVRVRETLPDRILDLADEVIFIDCPPDILRDRLRAGKIYPADRIDRALNNFFRPENLAALRELALRESIRARGVRRGQSAISRIMVGVADRERDEYIVRRAAAIAGRLEVGFSVAHVAREPAYSSDALTNLRTLCRDLRGRWVLQIADDAASGLVAAAGADGATTIAVEGAETRPKLFSRPSFARRLLKAGSQDLLVLTATL